MDRDKALERVLRLVALAVDPSQTKDGEPSPEARTAAWSACKLLHEHRLLSSPTAEAPSEEEEAPPPTPRRPRKKARTWSQAYKSKTDTTADDFARRYGTPKPAPETPPRDEPSVQGSRRGTFGLAKFHGQCLYCGFVIRKGEEIFFMPGFGSDHKKCALKRAGLEVE